MSSMDSFLGTKVKCRGVHPGHGRASRPNVYGRYEGYYILKRRDVWSVQILFLPG